jgi:hypothetical protein
LSTSHHILDFVSVRSGPRHLSTMKSPLVRSLVASVSLAVLALALVAAPVSGSPIRQPHQVRDTVPLPSPTPSETPTPLPSPAASTDWLKTQEEIRNRAKALSKTLAEERAARDEKYRRKKKTWRAQNQIIVDAVAKGRPAWELLPIQGQVSKLNELFQTELLEMRMEYVKDKNILLRAQRDQVEALEAEWKTVTGGREKLGVDFGIPRFLKPMDFVFPMDAKDF